MKTEDKTLDNQINIVNDAFHQILFSMMFHRQEMGSEDIQKFTFAEMHLLGLAYYNPDMILKEIREYLNIPQTTLSSTVAKLEKNGFLKRVINQRDLRSFSIELTQKGKDRFEEHQELDYKQVKSILLSLTQGERKDLANVLSKIAVRFGKGDKIKH